MNNLPFDIVLDEQFTRGTFVEIHIADIHFGAMEPELQYRILQEQFIQRIQDIRFDIISINGDLYDRKFLASEPAVRYANQFIADLVRLCELNGATLMILEGTETHDAFQLRSLYHYLKEPTIDFRIVETASFQYVKGKTILCLPEEYGKGEDYYKSLLNSRDYDACYMHGTFAGAIYNKNVENLDAPREPVFDINNFWRCTGPIIAGHVHTAQCLKGHFYYCGSPYRWQFGEEQPKGFFVLLQNLTTGMYYNHFEQITSFRYDTVDLDSILLTDPDKVVKYIDTLRGEGIDHLRIKIRKYSDIVPLLKQHYRENKFIKIDDKSKNEVALQATQDVLDKYKGLEFLYDPKLSEYQKFIMYVNHFEGEGFITLDELMELLKE